MGATLIQTDFLTHMQRLSIERKAMTFSLSLSLPLSLWRDQRLSQVSETSKMILKIAFVDLIV
jgi:hypothetical protein